MGHRCAWLWPALILLAGITYQWLVYSAVAGEQSDSIRFALAYVPLAGLGVWVAGRARHKLRWLLVLTAAGIAIYGLGQHAPWGYAAAFGAPHAAIYLCLLALFARTLRAGHEPLITRLARRVHGTLPPQLAAYTRRLTIAWCVFFGMQVVVSAVLFQFASLAHWSIFVNVLNFPLLALMFIGEYAYRILRHSDFPHASMLDGVRAFSRDGDHKTAGARTEPAVTGLALLRAHGDGAVIAYDGDRAIGVGQFLQDVAALAALLPARDYMFNLCSDRYRFMVGFCAALVKGQINLLPPNHTPDLIGRLMRRYSAVYCLTDSANDYPALDTLRYPAMTGDRTTTAPVPFIPAAQIAAIVFTSGSTGEPVPNEKSWGALVGGATAELARLGSHLKPGMAVLGTVPPQHMYGLESAMLMVMQGGLALHSGRPFYPADVLAALAALPRPRCLITTPVHLRAVLSEPGELPALDLVVCATAPLAPQLAAAAETGFAAPLYEIYGCTEAGQVASRRTTHTAQWQVLPGLSMRTHGNQTSVSGGHVEGTIVLQDVIELRGADRFLLHGRSTDLVNIAGKRTSLASLNFHLNSITGVRDGVFVVPEQGDGAVTRLTALVVAPGMTPEAVMNALRERIDAAFLPRPLRLVEALPRNATGKLPREALAQFSTQRTAEAG